MESEGVVHGKNTRWCSSVLLGRLGHEGAVEHAATSDDLAALRRHDVGHGWPRLDGGRLRSGVSTAAAFHLESVFRTRAVGLFRPHHENGVRMLALGSASLRLAIVVHGQVPRPERGVRLALVVQPERHLRVRLDVGDLRRERRADLAAGRNLRTRGVVEDGGPEIIQLDAATPPVGRGDDDGSDAAVELAHDALLQYPWWRKVHRPRGERDWCPKLPQATFGIGARCGYCHPEIGVLYQASKLVYALVFWKYSPPQNRRIKNSSWYFVRSIFYESVGL